MFIRGHEVNISERPLVIVELSTSGPDPHEHNHEIIEIAAAQIDTVTFDTIRTFQLRVTPDRLDRGDQETLVANGFSMANWCGASTFKQAISGFVRFADGAILASRNILIPWSFLDKACRELGHANGLDDLMDYHRAHLWNVPMDDFIDADWQRGRLEQLAEIYEIPLPLEMEKPSDRIELIRQLFLHIRSLPKMASVTHIPWVGSSVAA